MPAANPSESKIARFISGLKKGGLEIAEASLSADGTVRVIASGAAARLSSAREKENAWDRAQGGSN